VASKCPPLEQLRSILAKALDVPRETVDGVFCEAGKQVPLSEDDARLAGQPAARALTIGGELDVDAAEAKDLLPKVAQLSDSKAIEGSRFVSALSDALNFIGTIDQLRRPLHMPNQVVDIHARKTCRGDLAWPLGDDSNGTNCPTTMAAGSTCAAQCNSGALANGSFICLAGKVRLKSVCPGFGSVTLGEKVLFTLKAVASQCPSPERMRRILAAALQVDRDTLNGVFCEEGEEVPLSEDDARLAGQATARTLTIGSDLNADVDEAQDLLPRVAQLPDTTTPVGMHFVIAMRGALNYIGSVEQLHRPHHAPDQVMDFKESCRGGDAQPLGSDGNGTDCPTTMLHGKTCAARCNSSANVTGNFVCLVGKVRLASMCVGENLEGAVTLGNKLLFTLGGLALACPSPEQLRTIIASSLGVNSSIVDGVFCEPGKVVSLSAADARLAGQPTAIFVTVGGELNPGAHEAQSLLEQVKQLPDRSTDVGTRFATALLNLNGFIAYLHHLHTPLLMSRQVTIYVINSVPPTTPTVPPPIDNTVVATGLASGYLAALLVAAPLALGMCAVGVCWCAGRFRDTGGKKTDMDYAEV